MDAIPYRLIAKYLSGECTKQEIKELEEWRTANPANKLEFNALAKTWDNTEKELFTPDAEAALNKVSAQLRQESNSSRNRVTSGLKIAAAFILLIGIVSLFFALNKTSNLKVIATNASEMNKEVILEDGSVIHLNSNSKIEFPKRFSKNERKIKFKGEAYFSIAKDKNRPFIVETANTLTKVLGTQFNLTTNRSDSLVRISVTEGLVSYKLKDGAEQKEVLVKAGYIGLVDTKHKRISSHVNDDINFMAWKSGVLQFKDQEFGRSVQTISSFYGKNLIVDSKGGLDRVVFNLTLDSLSFDEALKSIELSMNVDIEKRGDDFYIREKL